MRQYTPLLEVNQAIISLVVIDNVDGTGPSYM